MEETLNDRLKAADERKQNGQWVPACGGTETPFKSRSGITLLYCYQPSSGSHAYLNCDTDIFLSDGEALEALCKF